MTISAGAFTLLSWVVFILPMFSNAAPGATINFSPSGLPAIDMALFMVAFNVFLVATHPAVRRFLGYFSLMMLFWTVGDLSVATLTVRNQVQPGNYFDITWVIGGCLLVLGLAYRVAHPEMNIATDRETQRENRWFGPQLQSVLPMAAALALVVYLMVIWQTERSLPMAVLWFTAIIWLLLIARQGVAAGEFELEQYATLVNYAAEPVFICNAEGKLTLVNPALVEATHYENEADLLGKPLSVLFSSETLPGGFRNPRYLMEHWSGEVSIQRKDGGTFPADITLQPISRKGLGRTSLAGTAHDLSEQKRQQEELQQAYEKISATHAELEQLNQKLEILVDAKTRDLKAAYHQLELQNQSLQILDQAKSDFVSMVSHELRAPLTNISGGIELVMARDAALSQNTHESLTIVQAETRRLAKYVDTILDLSALEAGKMPLYPAPMSAGEVVSRVIHQFSQFREASRLKVNIPGDLPPVMADENALTSVLFHLIDNAMKYAPDGTITVSAGVQEKRVFIQIKDQGQGIPQERLVIVYDKFTRLNPKDSQTVYGYGLGLYIVKRLLESMDGEIRAENNPEGGASFTFWLPQAEEGDDYKSPAGG
jgi:PAS domain S-box-containing protein